MGYIENLQAQVQQAEKAKAFDNQQKMAELESISNQAYKAGQTDTENSLVNALREMDRQASMGLADSFVDTRGLDGVQYYTDNRPSARDLPVQEDVQIAPRSYEGNTEMPMDLEATGLSGMTREQVEGMR